ncbi:MAG: acetylglutamate kinase [Rectinemataceae bacterium]
MSISDSEKAGTLAQALPYIQRYQGKTIVVKYGGAAMVNESLRAAVAEDLVLMSCVGIRAVLVHGGGPEIDAMLRRLGKEPVFVDGLRYTDEETMEVVQMVLAGKVNKDLVGLIQRAGGAALGLCGLDGGLLSAKRMGKGGPGGADLGLVGEIAEVRVEVLRAAMNGGYIPVVATVAGGIGNDPKSYNVNADSAAADIAIALGAEKLLLLTDVPGILRDLRDEGTLIKEMLRSELDDYKKEGILSKGMIPKVECCARAVDGGVARAHIIDGRSPHSLLVELFSDAGIGTMIL